MVGRSGNPRRGRRWLCCPNVRRCETSDPDAPGNNQHKSRGHRWSVRSGWSRWRVAIFLEIIPPFLKSSCCFDDAPGPIWRLAHFCTTTIPGNRERTIPRVVSVRQEMSATSPLQADTRTTITAIARPKLIRFRASTASARHGCRFHCCAWLSETQDDLHYGRGNESPHFSPQAGSRLTDADSSAGTHWRIHFPGADKCQRAC